jgi:hypothetical protein
MGMSLTRTPSGSILDYQKYGGDAGFLLFKDYDQICSNLYVSVLLLSLWHHAGVFLERSQSYKRTSPPAEIMPRWVS